MKRCRIIALAVSVALAFASSGGPRHAQAAAQKHDHPAAAAIAHGHGQHQAGDTHSHNHGESAASQFSESGKHDHAGTPPATDQGCCYAWCTTVAIIHAADGFQVAPTHDEHFTSEQPFRIAASPSLIDPPPR
jgi:hypothetical protein